MSVDASKWKHVFAISQRTQLLSSCVAARYKPCSISLRSTVKRRGVVPRALRALTFGCATAVWREGDVSDADGASHAAPGTEVADDMDFVINGQSAELTNCALLDPTRSWASVRASTRFEVWSLDRREREFFCKRHAPTAIFFQTRSVTAT
jgi:hypothetical protein